VRERHSKLLQEEELPAEQLQLEILGFFVEPTAIFSEESFAFGEKEATSRKERRANHFDIETPN